MLQGSSAVLETGPHYIQILESLYYCSTATDQESNFQAGFTVCWACADAVPLYVTLFVPELYISLSFAAPT